MNVIVGTGKKQITLSLSRGATVGELKKDYSAQTSKSIHRLSFKTGDGKTRLDDDKKSLSEYGIKSGDNLVFKVSSLLYFHMKIYHFLIISFLLCYLFPVC